MNKPTMFIFIIIAGIVPLNGQINEPQQTGNRNTIQGTVLDINGTPVENAIIFIDSKETKTKTDVNGYYNVKVGKNSEKIGVVAFGTGILEQDIEGRSVIDFLFEKESADLADLKANSENSEALLSTGYSKVKQKYSAASVGFLDVEHSGKKYNSLQQILMETPGLRYINGMFLVVGGASNFSGSVAPLFVLDDVPLNNIPNLTPSEISSITVLKGAAGAIYGSRAFGGVVIITTRIP